MPWWANLVWCVVFALLVLRPRIGVALGAVALLLRVYAVAGSVNRVWMLSGFGWAVVMSFYALTALWLVLLVMLWRGTARALAAALAAWMIPFAALEALGALLGARLELRSVSAAVCGVAQVLFLRQIARASWV